MVKPAGTLMMAVLLVKNSTVSGLGSPPMLPLPPASESISASELGENEMP